MIFFMFSTLLAFVLVRAGFASIRVLKSQRIHGFHGDEVYHEMYHRKPKITPMLNPFHNFKKRMFFTTSYAGFLGYIL